MAENKNKVIVYADWIHIFDKLKPAEAGKLIQHFFRYINDQDPVAPDRLTELTFEPIKQTLKRDLIAYNEKKSKNSDNAKKRWNDAKHANASEGIKKDAKHADRDNVNGSVNDNVTVSSNDDVEVTRAREYPSSTPTAKEFEKIEKLKTDFAADQPWLDERGKEFSLPREGIIARLDEFEVHLRGGKDHFKTRKDFANHFRNWLRKNINGSINQKGNGSPTAALMRW